MQNTKSDKVSFNKLNLIGTELAYIEQAIDGGHLLGGGTFANACEEWLRSNLGAKHAFLTHSCTAALEISAILSSVGPGDEVIMPSYTFVSTANAFVLRGATPVFVDVGNGDLNIDADLIAAAITPRTKAIVPVHYAGVACEMNRILETAEGANLIVIEDAAQAIGTVLNDDHLGTIGHMGCFSFHQTKNVVCGEGGALILNDERLHARANIIREKGTDRQNFLSGTVNKYTWVDVGSSYMPSELIAAFLYGQLKNSKSTNRTRRNKVRVYEILMEPLFSRGLLRPPGVKLSKEGNGHMMYCFAESQAIRDRLIKHLETKNIQAAFHYVPLHSSPAGLRYGRVGSNMAVTDWAGACQFRLPLYANIEEAEQIRVVEAITSFFK